MVTVVVKHGVEEYERWKPYYDDHATARREQGERGYQFYHVADEPNELVMGFEWDTHENARAFTESEVRKTVLKEAGVVGEPDVYFLDEIETKTSDTPMA